MLKHAALLVASLLISLLVGELLLVAIGFSYPAWYEPDDVIGWRHRPSLDATWTSESHETVITNDIGFRDKQWSIDKPAKTYRIAVLGDSFLDAVQVDVEETYWRMLEVKLNQCAATESVNVEVMNFGISGFGTYQQLLTFRHIASKYSPDMALLAFVVRHNVRNNSRQLEPN